MRCEWESRRRFWRRPADAIIAKIGSILASIPAGTPSLRKHKMKRVIIDLDNTLCVAEKGDYHNADPRQDVIRSLRAFRSQGYGIVIHTSRNMNTYGGNVGLINANTLPIILDWLARHEVPFDEVVVGKPWCGEGGFYVDDRALRPSEFARLSATEIDALLDG